jgi:hypothetical protein
LSDETPSKGKFAPYLSGDRNTGDAIARALDRLPADVLDFAITKCIFVSAGSAQKNGQCLPKWCLHGDWLILLNDQSPDLETVIAHEVAHAWLGHGEEGDFRSDTESMENQAREKACEWGFTGRRG